MEPLNHGERADEQIGCASVQEIDKEARFPECDAERKMADEKRNVGQTIDSRVMFGCTPTRRAAVQGRPALPVRLFFARYRCQERNWPGRWGMFVKHMFMAEAR
uniref:Uncharacterized protein n=2 Tax=Paenibacillus athensensis TaxID=1967502 RepID=A0A4Y8Q8S2_9BACL